MKKIFLTIPGIHGSDANHWQTQWENRYRNFKRVNQNNWDYPEASEWVKALEYKVSRFPHHAIYLIAHSMGCHTVARWAQETSITVAGALLVAPPEVSRLEQDGRVNGFVHAQAESLPFPSIVVASSNDEYASPQVAQNYAQTWGSHFVNIGPIGHINSASNIGQWSEGLRILNDFINTAHVNVR